MQNNSLQSITVCMATYNGEKFIAEQLYSILNQLKHTDEIIISDDSSNDQTLEIITNINDSRIRILKNNTFFNPILNFENALKQASGDIIFLADQDDVWLPDRVEKTLLLLKFNDLILCDNQLIDAEGKTLYNSFFSLNFSRKGLLHNILRNSYIGCCMTFNQKILTKALPFPSDIPMHDWWIGIIAESCGKICFHHEQLVLYRRHGNNASASGEASLYTIYRKIYFRTVLIKNLIKRCIFHA